jgi:hypothetical protein
LRIAFSGNHHRAKESESAASETVRQWASETGRGWHRMSRQSSLRIFDDHLESLGWHRLSNLETHIYITLEVQRPEWHRRSSSGAGGEFCSFKPS